MSKGHPLSVLLIAAPTDSDRGREGGVRVLVLVPAVVVVKT